MSKPRAPMSQLGHSRQFGDVPVTSASPPKADIHREVRHVRLVPTSEATDARLREFRIQTLMSVRNQRLAQMSRVCQEALDEIKVRSAVAFPDPDTVAEFQIRIAANVIGWPVR
jgi:hypothetical protein